MKYGKHLYMRGTKGTPQTKDLNKLLSPTRKRNTSRFVYNTNRKRTTHNKTRRLKNG